MKEMYKAIEELRESYEIEIKEAIDNGFDEIADSLREDLKSEEEGLISQYEEEKMKQIELIREKYKKPGS
jgi:predicted nucleotide-binding protein (sugar kinase/HSP70/actin superfamily)